MLGCLRSVTAALEAAIQTKIGWVRSETLDGRIKPGHDNGELR